MNKKILKSLYVFVYKYFKMFVYLLRYLLAQFTVAINIDVSNIGGGAFLRTCAVNISGI